MQHFGITSEDIITIGGDYNIPLTNQGKKRGSLKLKSNVIPLINNIMSYFSLQDIWRIKHTNKQQITWRQKRPSIQCRLDYFLFIGIITRPSN